MIFNPKLFVVHENPQGGCASKCWAKALRFWIPVLALQGLLPWPCQAAHMFSVSDSHLEMEKTSVSLSWEYFETEVTGN